MPGPIQRLGQSDLHNTGTMQRLADIVNEGQYVSVTGDMEAMATPSGRGILHNRFSQIFDRRFAQIVSSGPGTDPRYTLKVLAIMGSSDAGTNPPKTSDNLQFQLEPNPSLYPEGGTDLPAGTVGSYIQAINLGEVRTTLKSADGTRLLHTDGSLIVEVFCTYDNENPQTPHWFFVKEPAVVIPVTLVMTGGADGSGTTSPTYTYDIKDLYSGITLNTNQTPWNIRTVGKALVGSKGYAHFDTGSSGKYILGLCNETPSASGCS